MENQPLSNWRGKAIGRYQLLQQIGRGGMSEVWLATDTRLRRQVALKILSPVLASEETYLRDFAYEARAAASLEHPHILGVHDFGEQRVGQGEVVPYLVMPYMPGGTLRERINAASGPLSVQESLRYLRQAGQAIDYAHSRGVIHRDIKPANMLLRDDWLLLSDFGIAKILNSSTAHSRTSAGSGTPEYMAPEQIIGQAVPASDRYSLAVVAYQLFTGHEPLRGTSAAETLALHIQGQVPEPRRWNPQIPPEVERLLLLALARQPEARPPSAQVLVDALQQAWMRGVQVQSDDPDSTLLAPWSKRLANGPVSLSGSLPAAAPVSSPVLPQPQQRGAPSALFNADPVPGLRQSQVMTGSMTSTPGGVYASAADPFATGVSSDAGQLSPARTTPPLEESLLERKLGRRSIVLGGSLAAAAVIGGGVVALQALHAHGVVPAGRPVASTPVPGPRQLIPGVPVLALTGHSDEVWVASWSPDGRYLLTAGRDRYIMLWDLAAELKKQAPARLLATPLRRWTVANIQFTNLPDCVCWSPDGKKVIAGNDFTDKVYVLAAFGNSTAPAIYRNASVNANNGYPAIYTDVIAGPRANHFSVVTSSQVQVWDLARTDQPEVSYQASEDLGTMAWSHDGRMLAALSRTFGSSSQFFLWQATNPAHPQSWNLPQRDANFSLLRLADTVAWSPTDPDLLLLSDADVAFIWRVSQEKPVLMLGAQGQAGASTPVVGKMSWSPNGRYVAGSYDRLGDSRAGDPVKNPQLLVWDVQALLKSANSFSAETALAPILAFASGNTLQHRASITDFEWSPGGRYLATASLDKTVLIWQVDSAQR
jgi:serine/threonine protein kinase/WD40 repeat protein